MILVLVGCGAEISNRPEEQWNNDTKCIEMLRTGTTAWKKFSTCCTSRSAPIPLGSTGTVTCSLRLDYKAHGPIGPIAFFLSGLHFSWRWNMMETWWKPHIDNVLLDISQRLISLGIYPGLMKSRSWGHWRWENRDAWHLRLRFHQISSWTAWFRIDLGLSNVEHTKGSSRFTSGFCWSLNLTIVHYFSELIFCFWLITMPH